MKDLLIFGSGGFAKEVLIHAESTDIFQVKAFVDIDRGEPISVRGRSIQVIAESELSNNHGAAAFAIGIGDPMIIKKISERFGNVLDFPNIVHSSAIVGEKDVTLGRGNIITPQVVFTTNCVVGSFNIFNLTCTVGHDTRIGNHNVFNPGANISGGVTIGDNTLVGTNATILQNIRVHDDATIGAASLVNKNVDAATVVVGVPAKAIRKAPTDE